MGRECSPSSRAIEHEVVTETLGTRENGDVLGKMDALEVRKSRDSSNGDV